jgi:hypothetical protein
VGVNVFGWGVGPLAAARSFDATRSYDGILLVLTGALAFGSLLMLVLAVQRPAGAITEADARK